MTKSLSKLLVPLGAALLLALSAAAASADTSYSPTGTFGATPGDGEMGYPQHLAVQTSTGNVFVADRDNNRVQVFVPDGAGSATYLAQFTSAALAAPVGIALDQSTGDVYVSDADGIAKFTSDNAATPTFTQDLTFAAPSVTGPIAFDQADHQLLVADTATNLVRRYDTDGTPDTTTPTFDGSSSGSAFSQLRDITVRDDGHVVVVDANRVVETDADGTRGAALPDLPGYPTVVTAVPGGDALLVGQSGGYTPDFSVQLSSARLYRYTGRTYTGRVVLSSNDQGLFGLAVSGAGDGNLYAAIGPEVFGAGDVAVQVLTPFVVQAPVLSDVAADPTQVGARLTGKINPNDDDTTWTFEYGTTASYGEQFPAAPASIPSGHDPVLVGKTIGGLQPGTTYHYRLTATNGGGVSHSADQTFTTKAATLPSDAGQVTDRAYEQVTPVDKNGVVPDLRQTTLATASGDAIVYSTPGALPGSDTSIFQGFFVARRDAARGWESKSTDVRQESRRAGALDIQIAATLAISSDLRRSLSSSSLALVPGAIDGGSNLYYKDILTGDVTLAYANPAPQLRAALASFSRSPASVLASDDVSHAVISTYAPVTSDAAPFSPNVFELYPGGMRLAGVVGGATPSGGSISRTSANDQVANSISADGRRIFFTANPDFSGNGVLYMREDGARTLPISVSRRTGDVGALESASFVGASKDGSVVYFRSGAQLTDDATTTPGTSDALYRYDVADQQVSAVTGPLDFSHGNGLGTVLSISPDGATVVFTASLTDTSGANLVNDLYVASPGRLTHIGDAKSISNAPGLVGAVSANQRFVAFHSRVPQGVFDDPDDGHCQQPLTSQPGQYSYECTQVYVFDRLRDELRCPSCTSPGSDNGQSALRSSTQNFSRPGTVVLDDGSLVYESRKQLVSGDTNGKSDVYEWSWATGTNRLITPGNQPFDAHVAEITPDGKSVFFVTAQRLVGQDRDDLDDLYVARTGGGIPAQNQSVEAGTGCADDGCQAAPAASSAPTDPASSAFAGSGNVPGASPVRPRAAAIKVSKLKTAAGPSTALKVNVTRPGAITATGPGIATTRRAAGKAGTYSLRLTLTSRARASLAKRKSLKVKVKVALAPRSGSVKSVSVTIAFRSPGHVKLGTAKAGR